MGGDYYDRPVLEANKPNHQQPNENVQQNQQYSETSRKIFENNKSLHKSNDPKRFASQNLICKHKNPIIFALDVTGSMGDWSKVFLFNIVNNSEFFIDYI